MIARILMALSAGVVFTLGAIHLVYTFWGPKLLPRDPALIEKMAEVSPVITRQTTIWRAWIGFNASHSMGAMLFGLIFGYFAIAQHQLLFQSPFLIVVGLAMLGGLLVLGKRYWFSVPIAGVTIALACYVLTSFSHCFDRPDITGACRGIRFAGFGDWPGSRVSRSAANPHCGGSTSSAAEESVQSVTPLGAPAGDTDSAVSNPEPIDHALHRRLWLWGDP